MENEKRLIEVKSAWKKAQRIYSDPVLLHAIKNVLDETPTIDAVEVVHGRWEKRETIVFDDEMVGYSCSNCNTTWDAATNYCPNCGTKMINVEELK